MDENSKNQLNKPRPIRSRSRVEFKASKKEPRISNVTAILIIATALFIDILEMITTWKVIGIVLGLITPVFANLVFWFWFKLKDVSIYFDSPKKIITAGTFNLIEIIPALDALGPFGAGWTMWAIAIIVMTRVEDKTGISIPTSPKKASTGKISRKKTA